MKQPCSCVIMQFYTLKPEWVLKPKISGWLMSESVTLHKKPSSDDSSPSSALFSFIYWGNSGWGESTAAIPSWDWNQQPLGQKPASWTTSALPVMPCANMVVSILQLTQSVVLQQYSFVLLPEVTTSAPLQGHRFLTDLQRKHQSRDLVQHR